MQIKDLLLMYPDIRDYPNANAENYEKVVTQASRHCKRSDMSELDEIARPNEENVFKQWRKDNRRHITVSVIMSFKLMLIRVLQSSLEEVKTEAFPNINKFAYDDLISISLLDPNAKVIDWPLNPANRDIAPALPLNLGGMAGNMKITTETMIVRSDVIHYQDENIFIFNKGIRNLGTEKDPEEYPYFGACDDKMFYLLEPMKVDKTKIEYVPVVWYVHSLERLPVAEMPGMKSDEGYKESICMGAFEILDEAAQAISSDQVTRIRHSQPKLVVNADLVCPKCNSTGIETIAGDKIPCRSCNGSGYLQNIGDFATVKIRGKNEFDRANSNPIYYVAAPANIEYPMVVWEKLLSKAERQLCTDLLEGTGNESGIAKELRMEPKQDMLKMYGEQFCEMLQNVINNRVQLRNFKEKPIVISAPSYYQTKSHDMIRMELVNALPGERFITYMNLVKSKYRGNDYMIKVNQIAVLYAPLLLYKTDELETVIGLGSYNENDVKRRDYAVYVFSEILTEESNMKKSAKELFDMANQMLIEMGILVENQESLGMEDVPLDEITDVAQLPDDLDELEEVLSKLLNEEISREEALRLVVIIEGVSEDEAEELLTDTGL